MRTKMKISYHASAKQISFLEHFIVALIKSYKELHLEEFKQQASRSGKAALQIAGLRSLDADILDS